MGTASNGKPHAQIPHSGLPTRGGFGGIATGATGTGCGAGNSGTIASAGGVCETAARRVRVLLRYTSPIQTASPAVPSTTTILMMVGMKG